MPRSTPVKRDSMLFLAGRRAIDDPYLPSKGLMCQDQMLDLCAFFAPRRARRLYSPRAARLSL